MSNLMDLYWAKMFLKGKPIKPFDLKMLEIREPLHWLNRLNEKQLKFALKHYVCSLVKLDSQWVLHIYDNKTAIYASIGDWTYELNETDIGQFVIIQGYKKPPKDLNKYIKYKERRPYIVTLVTENQTIDFLTLSYGKVICIPKKSFDYIYDITDINDIDLVPKFKIALTKDDWEVLREMDIKFGKEPKYVYKGILVDEVWLRRFQK